MRLTVLTGITAVLVLAAIVELLRRRQLREKYAVLWMVVSLAVLVLGAFPTLLDSVTRLLGVASGASLVLFLGIVFLLMVCVHLSWEASRLEDETRTLAEELALVRAMISDSRFSRTGRSGVTDPAGLMDPAGVTDPARPTDREPVK